MADKECNLTDEELEVVMKAAEKLRDEKNEDEAKVEDEAKESQKQEDVIEEEAGEEAEEAPEKKGLFGKKKDKKDKKDVQIEELTDKLKRQMAEFENFRKRTEKEKSAMYEIGAKDVIEKILPIVDNFERGLQQVPEEGKADSFVEGMNMVYKQLIAILEGIDVKVIEAVGKEFDPNYHNAVMHVEDEVLEANIVAEEFQKGYTYRGSVIRHSMVKVAN